METSLGVIAKVASLILAIRPADRQLRAERANLLGYEIGCVSAGRPNCARCSDREQTAGRSRAAGGGNAKRKRPTCRRLSTRRKADFKIAAWDWDFYSEKVRKARYTFDESELRPYYELNHVFLDGVFFAANKEYGLTFKERHDLPVYQPDVRVWEVFRSRWQTARDFHRRLLRASHRNAAAHG